MSGQQHYCNYCKGQLRIDISIRNDSKIDLEVVKLYSLRRKTDRKFLARNPDAGMVSVYLPGFIAPSFNFTENPKDWRVVRLSNQEAQELLNSIDMHRFKSDPDGYYADLEIIKAEAPLP